MGKVEGCWDPLLWQRHHLDEGGCVKALPVDENLLSCALQDVGHDGRLPVMCTQKDSRPDRCDKGDSHAWENPRL